MIDAALATVLAVVRLLGVAAVGLPLRRTGREARLAVPAALLIGGAVLGAIDASLLAYGLRDAALATDLALSIGALALSGRATLRAFGELLGPFWRWATATRFAAVATAAVVVVYWANGATPPHDTDSLRYHLAHLQQIDAEGRWTSMPIIHYAFPFAWQTTFLPFMHIRLAEAAQLVNVGLTIVTAAAIIGPRDAARPTAQRWIILAIALSPAVVTTATIASADPFLVLAAAAGALIVREGSDVERDAALAGLVAWVALGSRYQGAALGLALSSVVVTRIIRARSLPALGAFIAGAAAAVVLAFPFYLVNFRAFGNAVWPLFAHGSSYADVVARGFEQGWTGRRSIVFIGSALGRLLVDPNAFPLPQLAGASLAAIGLLGKRLEPETRRVVLLVLLFMIVWAFEQPMLYPRFIVFLGGPIALLALDLGETLAERALIRRAIVASCAAASVAMGAYAVSYTAFSISYLLTGDAARFHRFDWYYDVYQWANSNLPANARILVITRSAESYGLERWYRRADPSTSALIDWRRVRDVRALDNVLDSVGITHVIYDAGPWSANGGAEMRTAIEAAAAAGDLVVLRRFDLALTRSRFRGGTTPATVTVYVRRLR